MKTLSYKGYEGSAELDMDRGVCRGKVLFVNDLVTYETVTPAQLQGEFEAAVDDYIATCLQIGKSPQRPFKGLFNVRVSPDLHKMAAVRAVADSTTLNDIVTRALSAYLSMNSGGADAPQVVSVLTFSGVASGPSQAANWTSYGH